MSFWEWCFAVYIGASNISKTQTSPDMAHTLPSWMISNRAQLVICRGGWRVMTSHCKGPYQPTSKMEYQKGFESRSVGRLLLIVSCYESLFLIICVLLLNTALSIVHYVFCVLFVYFCVCCFVFFVFTILYIVYCCLLSWTKGWPASLIQKLCQVMAGPVYPLEPVARLGLNLQKSDLLSLLLINKDLVWRLKLSTWLFCC